MSVITNFCSGISKHMPEEWKSGPIPSLTLFGLGNFLMTPLSTYIHENGHALAFKLLYQNVTPQIVLRKWGFGGGVVYPRVGYSNLMRDSSIATNLNMVLSSVGKLMGRTGVECVMYAAGPLVEAFSHLGMVVGTDSGITALLVLPVSMNLTYYALSTLLLNKMPSEGHDFYAILERGGTWAYMGVASVCIASTSFIAYKALKQVKKWGIALVPISDVPKKT